MVKQAFGAEGRHTRLGVVLAMAATALLAAGCGGTSARPSPGDSGAPVEFDGPAAYAPVADAPVDVQSQPAPDARPPREAAPAELPSAPLPPDVPPPIRVLDGEARLVGAGITSCTNQDPPSGNGDRWCAFKRADANATHTELWVFNLSAFLRNETLGCDSGSGNCVRLTTDLWTEETFGGPTQNQAHRFDGDTLLFHTPGSSGEDEPFSGPIWAWRPGWPAARQLTANGLICYSQGPQALAFCIENADKSAVVAFDLRAGSIADPATPPLLLVDRARVFRADHEVGFAATFTADGQAFVYSTTAEASSKKATLRVLKTSELGASTPVEIATDVMEWQLANDERKVYFLHEFTIANKEGALMMADFPSGLGVTQLARRTGRYVLLDDGTTADRGVGFFVTNTGRFLSEYRVIPDRDNLGSGHTVFRYSNQLEDFHVSRNQRFSGYAKYEEKLGFNGYLALNDGSGECILNSDLGFPAYEYYFLDHAGLVFWEEESPNGSTIQDGWFGDPDGCKAEQRFAADIGFYIPIRDEGLIFGDAYDGDTVTLKYAVITDGRNWPLGGPVTVREHVDLPVVRVGPRTSHLLFQVSQGADGERGIYVFALPFGRPAASDGDVADAGGGDSEAAATPKDGAAE